MRFGEGSARPRGRGLHDLQAEPGDLSEEEPLGSLVCHLCCYWGEQTREGLDTGSQLTADLRVGSQATVCVRVNFHCQPDWSWNDLEDTREVYVRREDPPYTWAGDPD